MPGQGITEATRSIKKRNVPANIGRIDFPISLLQRFGFKDKPLDLVNGAGSPHVAITQLPGQSQSLIKRIDAVYISLIAPFSDLANFCIMGLR